MRLTLDSNVLVYAFNSDAPDKQVIASDTIARAPYVDTVLTAQALGEFLNVIRRKYPVQSAAAQSQALRWASVFKVAVTSSETIQAAAAFAERHRLQFWDSVIWQAARSMGATTFLSEDMQDGFTADGMTVLNPFVPANSDRLAQLLEPRNSGSM